MTDKGFTILEVLVGIAIMVIAVTIVALSFSKLNKNVALDKSADTAISIFNEARSLTLSAKGASQYGVNIQSSQIVLFKGGSYSAGASTNVFTTLNSLVAIRNITLTGGGSSIVFDRLTGTTISSGTFEIYLKDVTTTYKTITISATGITEEN